MNYSKLYEKNEERMRDDLGINVFYDVLSVHSHHQAGQRVLETHCTWIVLVAYCRNEAFLSVYRRRQHRAWRFRAFAMRQRAEAMLINRLAGRCHDEEWHKIQNRLQPGDKQARRSVRHLNGIAPYDTTPPIFAWGDMSCSHARPWAPVPSQVIILILCFKTRIDKNPFPETDSGCCAEPYHLYGG